MDELIKQLAVIASELKELKEHLPGTPDETIIADELKPLLEIPHRLEMMDMTFESINGSLEDIRVELREINTREDSKNF